MKTREQIMELGRKDALLACEESGCSSAPDGGWDSWLINGLGIRATEEMWGVSCEDETGWAKACRWYDEGARVGAREWQKEQNQD